MDESKFLQEIFEPKVEEKEPCADCGTARVNCKCREKEAVNLDG